MRTHILLFGSKFHILLAVYVQMLDMYIKNIENIGYFRYFRYFRKYHDIFQPWVPGGRGGGHGPKVTHLKVIHLRR